MKQSEDRTIEEWYKILPKELPPEYWKSLGETIRDVSCLYADGNYGSSEREKHISRLIACYEAGVNPLPENTWRSMMSKEEPTGSIGVGDRVRIIGGIARGLIGVVQRLDTSRQGRCYVTSGGKIYDVQTDELILHNDSVKTR
jgi:hypothetical protein